MRNAVVAAIGGFALGHVLWLVGMYLAMNTSTVNAWVLVVAAASLALGAAGGPFGLRHYRRHSYTWASFLWALPVSPVLFSLAVLGVTYL